MCKYLASWALEGLPKNRDSQRSAVFFRVRSDRAVTKLSDNVMPFMRAVRTCLCF